MTCSSGPHPHRGPAGHPHECCWQLSPNCLFSGSSCPRGCTAGWRGVSASLAPPHLEIQGHREIMVLSARNGTLSFLAGIIRGHFGCSLLADSGASCFSALGCKKFGPLCRIPHKKSINGTRKSISHPMRILTSSGNIQSKVCPRACTFLLPRVSLIVFTDSWVWMGFGFASVRGPLAASGDTARKRTWICLCTHTHTKKLLGAVFTTFKRQSRSGVSSQPLQFPSLSTNQVVNENSID